MAYKNKAREKQRQKEKHRRRRKKAVIKRLKHWAQWYPELKIKFVV
jgi:hypothetical protein